MEKNLKEKNLTLPEIIKNYKNGIQSIIVSITGTKNVTDIEQEVYIKIWKNLSLYKDRGNLRAWIKRITVNTCKDHLKSKQYNNDRKTDFDDEAFVNVKDNKTTPENVLILAERRKQIINTIETLRPKLKEVVIFYDMQEMSYEEIAKKIKCPVGTVKSRLFNARKQLQKEFEERRIL